MSSTGYSPGRPRKGEVRPDNNNARAYRAYYARHKNDPEFRARRRKSQLRYKRHNSARVIILQANSQKRSKAWMNATRLNVSGPTTPHRVLAAIGTKKFTHDKRAAKKKAA